MTTDTLLLAGDIGGTKTTLALYTTKTWPAPPLREQTFANKTTTGLVKLITTFLQPEKKTPTLGCFGIAGPIRDNRVQMTNLDWLIDARELEQECGLNQVTLINDLVATAMGAVLLPKKELNTINIGLPHPEGTIGVLAPGTGLGEAFILRQHNQLFPVASEGGHASFAPCNHDQLELLNFLLQKEGHISIEKVCSGLGLPNIYAFLATRMEQPDSLQQQLAEAKDQTPILVNTALQALSAGDHQHICVHTLQIFIDILAAEAANLALKVLATGGIYIGGGIPPRILPFFQNKQFMAFFARGVYQKMLADIPVHIILNPNTALLGAAAYGMNQMNSLQSPANS
jgi:glucokinase